MEYHNPSSYSVSSSSNRSLSLSPNSTVYHQCLATLKGHTSSISSLTLSAKFLYTGSSDSQIITWNRIPQNSSSSSNNTVVLAGNGAVKSLLIQSNKLLFSAHQDHKIRVWKIKITNHEEHNRYTHVATLPTLGDRASKILIPKNHVQIRRHKKRTWVHHVDAVSALALSHDGDSLYSVSWDRTLKVWRTNDFACLESLPDAHRDAINALVVSRDGRVFTGSADQTIKVWKKFEGEKKHTLVQTLESHNSGVNALALSSDENFLYSAASDRDILVWEKLCDGDGDRKMGVVGALRGHTKSILCLCVVEDLVCSGSADKTIRIWRPHQYSCLAVLEGHTGSIKCISAVVDHSNNESHSQPSFLIYSGGLDCHVKVWQILVPPL